MNTGMESAANIRLRVDMPDKCIYLKNSSEGDDGVLYLKPTTESEIIGGDNRSEIELADNVRYLEWEIAGKIEPTIIKRLAFKIKINY
jgi:hypothetical protein